MFGFFRKRRYYKTVMDILFNSPEYRARMDILGGLLSERDFHVFLQDQIAHVRECYRRGYSIPMAIAILTETQMAEIEKYI